MNTTDFASQASLLANMTAMIDKVDNAVAHSSVTFANAWIVATDTERPVQGLTRQVDQDPFNQVDKQLPHKATTAKTQLEAEACAQIS